ncbi:hypothetical protein QWJ07_32075 [Frankia sp. RB7]|nr:hypothetical protein [Frankia sp. RB7]
MSKAPDGARKRLTTGALMSTASYNFSADFTAAPSRDAVDGLAAIASALDQGLVGAPNRRGQQFLDVCAIAVGWAVLVAVVLHPELQLAAIGLGIAIFALRSMWRLVLGPSEQTYPRRLSADRSAFQYG